MEEEIRLAMEGDADAFLGLMDRYNQQMYKTAWSILKRDADVADAIQETIIKCYEKIHTLRSPAFFRTWVMRVLINECYQILQTEDVFPDTMLDQNGQPVIDLLGSSMRFDYNPDPVMTDAYLDGAMVDDHTYAGVLRINLAETLRWPVIADNVSEGEKPEADGQITYETTTLPEQFSVQFTIPRLDGTLPESSMPEIPEDIRKEYEDAMAEAGLGTTDDAYASFSEEEQEIEGELYNRMWKQYVQRYPDANEYPNQYENWWVDGPWEFDFDVIVDHSETISVKANQEENCDIGEIEVTKTPFELAVNYDHNKAAEHDYFVAVLDAHGEMMGFGHQNGSTDEHPIAGHDVSEVTIYVCDYKEYMDELKGYGYSPDYEEKAKEKTYKQLLDERCVYSEKVSFVG